jgi:hypothetical protein
MVMAAAATVDLALGLVGRAVAMAAEEVGQAAVTVGAAVDPAAAMGVAATSPD